MKKNNIRIIEKDSFITLVGGFPFSTFRRDLREFYTTSRILNLFGTNKIQLHKFFIPEFFYVLNILNTKFVYREAYSHTMDSLLNSTWLSDTQQEYPSRIHKNNFNQLNYKLKDFQRDFIDLYDDKKQKYNLNGYILAFEQGLGKTFTSLALMHGLGKQRIIIIAPKSTLINVWQNEINKVFNGNTEVWFPGEGAKDCRFYIANYESIEKLHINDKYLRNNDIGIIADESHNFRSSDANRVINLIKLAKGLNCKDTLLMSGTPIKAIGTELIPMLDIIDPLMDDYVRSTLSKVFGSGYPIALDIINNRLGSMMHRKLKTEVANLPIKSHHTIKIKLANGYRYTEPNVKKEIAKYIEERSVFYKDNFKQFEDDYSECIEYVKPTLSNTPEFQSYVITIDMLINKGYIHRTTEFSHQIRVANLYEQEVIRPMLPPNLKKKFDHSKSVVKYVNLKIMGEVIGNLLTKLRVEMFKEMIYKSNMCKIINDSRKKTVIFTTYTDVLKEAEKYLNTKCKLHPVSIYGETSHEITKHLNSFKYDSNINPLLATVQTLSTGITVTEANTVIFINKPWRSTDMDQAEDRVHRIGQDTPVHVYSFVLDTGNEYNLSTRMEDVVKWSRKMFDGIVGEEEVDKILSTV